MNAPWPWARSTLAGLSLGVDTGSAARLDGAPTGYLQYLGFEQNGNTREYLFKCIPREGPSRECMVTADLALFARHRVGIQEGPGISSRLLAGQPAPSSEWPQSQSLTDDDMLRYRAEQVRRSAAEAPVRGRKRPAGAAGNDRC